MHRTLSTQLKLNIGKEVRVKGWLHNFRQLGKIAFVIVRDRSGLIQIIVEDKATINELKELQAGSILDITGKVVEAPNANLGVEINSPKITITNKVTEAWPVEINKSELNAHLDTILDFRPITLRHEKLKAIFKVQSTILAAYREFLISEGFTEFMGPAVIGASSEGGAELFTVDYFGNEAKLAQSNQLYKQMMVGVYERVFGSLKCFRAEKSNTRRHITEATQLEFEVGFIEKFEEILDWQEKVVRAILKKINEECKEEVKLFPNIAKLPENISIPRFTLKEAQELYFEETGNDERGEKDMSPDSERFISKYSKEKFGTDFAFVTHFPRSKCAFYAKPSEENPELCNYGDMICNGTEITSGGQRIDDYDELVASLEMKGLNPEDFKDYLMIFKYGMPAHGGFGMGLERATMQILGLDNIRETTLFPSDTKRIASVPIRKKLPTTDDEVVELIKKKLLDHNIEFKFEEHEEVITSEDASRVRGTKIEEGAKAIILVSKKSNENTMVVLPANLKIDMKKVKQKLGNDITMESPEVILSKFGIKVGGVPPFGDLLGMNVLVDEKLLNNEKVSFNCGKRTCSIEMSPKDLVKVVESEIGDWSQN